MKLSTSDDDEKDFNEIKIVLKPLNISSIHKREVEMSVPYY